MKIKFLRSVIADGEHQEAGSTAEIKDAEAIMLIRDGSAVEAGDKEKPTKETAEAKHPGKETAAK